MAMKCPDAEETNEVDNSPLTLASRKTSAEAVTGWTTQVIIAWFAVALIRGTTPTMLALAGDSISPPFVVVLRSPGALLLYLPLISVWYRRSSEYRDALKVVLRNPFTYLKLCIVGLCQSGAPFLLLTNGLKYLPPEFGGVFLALTPVWAMFNEQTVFRLVGKSRPVMNRYHLFGVTLIIAGVATFLLPVMLSLSDPTETVKLQCNLTTASNLTLNTTVDALSAKQRNRVCATLPQAIGSLFLMLLASYLLGLVAVYWKHYKGRIHFTVAGFGQNATGGLFVAVVWAFLEGGSTEANWNPGSIAAIAYLSTLSAFLTPCLIFYLLSTIGPVPASRAMTLVPIISWIQGRLFFSRDDDTIAPEIGGLACFLLGLILFEGRIDQICGLRMPWKHLVEKSGAGRRSSEQQLALCHVSESDCLDVEHVTPADHNSNTVFTEDINFTSILSHLPPDKEMIVSSV